MNSIVKDFLPPVLVKWLKSIKKGKEFNRVYPSYQEALKYCSANAYEEEELIEVILKKTIRFSQDLKAEIIPIWETTAYSLLSAINPIIESKTKEINVLDFGGACGAHYFHLRSLIQNEFKINWVVVETPMMVKKAKVLETNELSFFDNFEAARNKLTSIDLLHTSGTLQCVDSPDSYLNEVLNCNAKWLLLNRLGLNKSNRDLVTIQASKLSWNGIGPLPEGYTDRWFKYPLNFMSETRFLKALEEKYKPVAKFNDESGSRTIKGEKVVGYGLLCSRKTD